MDPSVEANVEGANVATKDAMAAWSSSSFAPRLSFEPAQTSNEPAIDQKNVILFKKGGYAPAGRAIAITVLTYDKGSGQIVDADVVVNGSYDLKVLDPHPAKSERGVHPTTTDGIVHGDVPTTSSTTYDFHHVIAHEIGHTLGMNDELTRNDALMFRYSAPNDASLRSPASDDIDGLAEIYNDTLTASGSGCGGATITPKRPHRTASHAAMAATLALVVFLVLRAKKDAGATSARFAFVLAVATATIGLLPELSDSKGVAKADTRASEGHALAKVLATHTSIENGIFKTTYELSTVACRMTSCPKLGHGTAWGGTIGDLRQEVGEQFVPETGSDVDVSFAKLPRILAPVSNPLANLVGAHQDDDVEVRVLTKASYESQQKRD